VFAIGSWGDLRRHSAAAATWTTKLCQAQPKSAPVCAVEKCTSEGGRDVEAAFAEAVALAFERDHGGVVDEPVDQGSGGLPRRPRERITHQLATTSASELRVTGQIR
jgi:hypothetical protein